MSQDDSLAYRRSSPIFLAEGLEEGFARPDSWTDEYRRIFDLFETTIGPKGSKAKR